MPNPSLIAMQEDAATTIDHISGRLDWFEAAFKRAGDVNLPFWYLSGPMTGYPQFNFPRFEEVANRLRGELGLNVISPHSFEDERTVRMALDSSDGAHAADLGGLTYRDLLSRDILAVALPNCYGVILLEGWEESTGAKAEATTAGVLSKEIYLYYDELVGTWANTNGKPYLLTFDGRINIRGQHRGVSVVTG